MSLAFSGFVTFLLLCCILFNIWRGLKKALHVELSTVEIPSATFANSTVSHDTFMEVCQLHSLCKTNTFVLNGYHFVQN
jgi:flagellar motor switch protein FliM